MRLRIFRILARSLALAASFRAAIYANDITIPLDGGTLVIGVDFHETTELAYKILYPDSHVYDLVYSIKNQTSSRWKMVRLRFDFGGLCAGKPRQWSIPITVTGLPPYSHDFEHVERGTQAVSASPKPIKLGGNVALPLPADLTGCGVEIVKAALLSAEGDSATIAGASAEPEDLSNELRAIQAQRDVEAAEQAKKDAGDAARQKRLAAERKKKQAEDDARSAKAKAERDAQQAEERRQVRAACSAVYQGTANKKIGDLTVREEQQVRACQALDLYPPQ